VTAIEHPVTERKRIRIRLRGIVQGVGFRPFVFKAATRLALAGHVLNTSAGLVAEVEGNPQAIDSFVRTITSEAPPLAWIQESEVTEIPVAYDRQFVIRESLAEAGEFALISPDVATCDLCVQDVTDPHNRRYRYPFTNCTNCGPRYSIVEDIPYDRPNTTMSRFRMCPDCQAEYDNPYDRRFHAQPNACPRCGPSLSAPIGEAIRRLVDGEIVAIKGLGGFQLACDARNSTAISALRTRKRRSEKPFALMCRDVHAAERLCEMSGEDRSALLSPRRPILILPRRAGADIPEAVAPGNRTLGIMLPYTPLHDLLFAGAPYETLIMTSGNISEEPIVVKNEDVLERLGPIADAFLLHDRDIFMRVDDSVVRTFEGATRVLRRARGYVPETIELAMDVPELLACGGELKNTFCLTKGRHAILSQHMGDLENYETLVFFEETLANLKKLFRVTPRAVAHDLHPNYLSTRYALRLPEMRAIGVQHHHAHIASCMAENALGGNVLGVAFDGTGFGTDGQIWGGEFLLASYAGFERLAHLRYVALPGGDAAVRETWRAALSYLLDSLGTSGLEFLHEIPEQRVRVVRRMIETGLNTVQTSSCGRLFDAVAAMIGLRRQNTFEAQAAIELETIADSTEAGRYGFAIDSGPACQLDFRTAIQEIANDLRQGRSQSCIAGKFHNTVAEAISTTCRRLSRETGLNRIVLSGGTFQNLKLLDRTVTQLRGDGLEVFLHRNVPPNDGGIALGQAAVAAAIFQNGA
jgi:hydrogenase maturation protein HypF